MDTAQWQTLQELFAAAIDLPEQDRESWLARSCVGRPELRRELDELLDAHKRAQSFMEPVPDCVGPYRLLEPAGHGGMGAVYRAERVDGQFRHQVAVKLSNLAGSAAFHRRFRAERQILANLAHPNIARLLDGGITSSGVSYIVMEYVDGLPIDRYCADRPLAERIRLFRTICSAVHYAHQNLVVHRDLKPANILVTPGGEPKLLDFGIAKMLEPSDEEATTLLPALTPEYASPEQVRGGTISTASDIYSLGVVLYELVTGRRPYHLAGKTYEEVRRIVCEDTLPKPVTGSADLDAVIVKAMRKEPAERYSSAEAFSADLGRYLAHRPVEAHRGAAWYVLNKFLRRNRIAVASACLVTLLLVAAVAIIVRESRIATRRFEDVRHLANSVVYQLHDAIAALPGSTPARKLLVADALGYLNKLSQDAAGDYALQMELGAAYLRLGDVQGLQSQANLGDPYGAIDSYQRAVSLFRAVVKSNPDNTRAPVGLSTGLRRLGIVQIGIRRAPEARVAVAECVAILEKLVRTQPTDAVRQELGTAYSTMADTLDQDPRYQSKALAIFESLLAEHPGDVERQRAVALIHKNIASPLVRRSFGDRALPHLRRAEELDAARAAADPNNREAQMDLSFDYSQNGTYYLNRELFADALLNYRRSLEIRRRLAEADKTDARLQDRLVYAYQRVGYALDELHRPKESLAAYKDAVRIGAALLAAQPRHPGYRTNLAGSRLSEGNAHQALGQKQDACAAWREALGLYQEIANPRPEDQEPVQKLKQRLAACDAGAR